MNETKYLAIALIAAGLVSASQVPEAHAIKKCVKFKTGGGITRTYTDRAEAQLIALRSLVRRTRVRYNQGYRPNPSSRDIRCNASLGTDHTARYHCGYNFTMCKER